VSLRVAVLDDHEIFRRGLRACLRDEPGIELADDAPLSEMGEVDVAVVSDEYLKALPPEVPVVVCSDECSPDSAHSARRVSAVLPRRSLRSEQLVAAVRAAAVGLSVVPDAEAPSRLDGRSISVLRLLAGGRGTREIAQQLGYSERTIKSVISGLELSLGARTRAQCVAEAVRRVII
jgi:DNA-binding NarL/FixJ family response regulator